METIHEATRSIYVYITHIVQDYNKKKNHIHLCG